MCVVGNDSPDGGIALLRTPWGAGSAGPSSSGASGGGSSSGLQLLGWLRDRRLAGVAALALDLDANRLAVASGDLVLIFDLERWAASRGTGGGGQGRGD